MARTYLEARVWLGLTPAFPASQFDTADDGPALAAALHAFVERTQAEVGVERTTLRALAESNGWLNLDAQTDPKWLAPARWEPFHAEDDRQSAEAIVVALEHLAPVKRTAVSLRCRTVDELPTLLVLEQELETLDLAGSGFEAMYRVRACGESPLRRLREEAARLSKHAREAAGRIILARTNAPASSTDVARAPSAAEAESVDVDDAEQPKEKQTHSRDPMAKHLPLAQAMLLVQEHPEWSNARIAKLIGRHPTWLSRNPTYRFAAANARQLRRELARGFETMDEETGLRGVEAHTNDDEKFDRGQRSRKRDD